jgi:hypothetical protein
MEGKLAPTPTGYEHKKLSPRYPAFAGREPNFRPPFERISDPQIPLTRQIFAIRVMISIGSLLISAFRSK